MSKMIIKCISKGAKNLAQDLQKKYHYDYEFDLVVGETFLVYAMLNVNRWCKYLIDNGLCYPNSYPAGLFEVIDPKISKY